MEPVKVKIRNAEYLVQGEDDEQQVQRIADYVNDKLKEIEQGSEGLSEKRTAILAALDIAGDYFQILREKEDLLSKVRHRTQSLIHSIDSVMGPSEKRRDPSYWGDFVETYTTCLQMRNRSGQKRTVGLVRHDGNEPFNISFRTYPHAPFGKH